MIQLTIRDASPVKCNSWTDAHKKLLESFDPAGHTSFVLTDEGFEWAEEEIHWRTFDAVASTPEAMRGYFKVIGRA